MYPTNYWSLILNPFGFDFYLKKEGNEHIDISKASEWGDYPSVRCNFVFKDGTKRQITFETDDTTSAEIPCAYRTGGEDEECLKLKVVTDIPIK